MKRRLSLREEAGAILAAVLRIFVTYDRSLSIPMSDCRLCESGLSGAVDYWIECCASTLRPLLR